MADLGRLDLDPLDLDPRAAVACGRWDWTGASDLNPTAGIACERPKRRRPAGDGGAWRRAAAELACVPNLGLRCTI
jgi:hypothetical protein